MHWKMSTGGATIMGYLSHNCGAARDANSIPPLPENVAKLTDTRKSLCAQYFAHSESTQAGLGVLPWIGATQHGSWRCVYNINTAQKKATRAFSTESLLDYHSNTDLWLANVAYFACKYHVSASLLPQCRNSAWDFIHYHGIYIW